ncbi:glycine cleavage system protein GcvH [Spirochaetia bacterium 38H-sp]|uniref:Glycine cleavage system H protein n=1 Tax=Rarispira pelagica TaxID=3141764 RepID=A0ABU9U9R1_9SPIR
MEYREGLYYAETHEWALLNNNDEIVICGISDYAQNSLGDVVFVELPEVGKEVKKGESFGVIESVKTTSDVHAPLSGKIVEVNAKLKDKPELINSSPFEEGWLIKIKPFNTAEMSSLMTVSDYKKYVESI